MTLRPSRRRFKARPLARSLSLHFPHAASLIALCAIFQTEDIHDAYSHGCNGIGLPFWIERRGAIWPSPPLSPLPTLCGPTGGLGAVGTCARRSAAIRGRTTISPDPGYTTVQTRAARPWALLSFGGTMSVRSSGRRMASGSSRAAMTDTRFGRGLDPWPVLSLSGMLTGHSECSVQRARQTGLIHANGG